MAPDIDEKNVDIRHDDPTQLPVGIALAKADALMARLRKMREDPNSLPPPPSSFSSSSSSFYSSSSSHIPSQGPILILTADQVVLFGNKEVREKPESASEAKRFLASYSNTSVATISCIVATLFPSGEQASTVHVATVHWNHIPSDMIDRIVSRGEIFSSAGGFRVEDVDLNACIKSVEGGIDSVMGMPIAATSSVISDVLRTAGLRGK